MRSRRPIRLLFCLPLIAVMGFWAYSFGRISNLEFRIGATLVGVIAVEGKLIISVATHTATVSYWLIWLIVAAITMLVDARFRAPRIPDLRR